MQTQRTAWLPLALIVLAVAIITAGVLISTSLNQAAVSNAQAQQRTTTAVNSAALQASQDSFQASQQARLQAQHDATMRMINGN